jgi:hypothetical protein
LITFGRRRRLVRPSAGRRRTSSESVPSVSQRTVALDPEDGYFEALGGVRGYARWRPRTEKQAILDHVQELLAKYQAQLPLTVRQLYYLMIGQHGYPKGEQFEAKLYDVVNRARRVDPEEQPVFHIPFDSIRDDGIMGSGSTLAYDADTVLDGWKRAAEYFSRHRQEDQEVRLEVWCEAAGMVPQLRRVASRYSVPALSSGGFNSLTAIRRIVDDAIIDGRDTVVLHLGDADPSGFSIYQNVYEDVAEFLSVDEPGLDFEAKRVAILREHIEEYDLVEDPIKTKDTRSLSWIERGFKTKVEIEALPPDVIAKLLEEAIEEHMDLDLIDEIEEREKEDRRRLIIAYDAARKAFDAEEAESGLEEDER